MSWMQTIPSLANGQVWLAQAAKKKVGSIVQTSVLNAFIENRWKGFLSTFYASRRDIIAGNGL